MLFFYPRNLSINVIKSDPHFIFIFALFESKNIFFNISYFLFIGHDPRENISSDSSYRLFAIISLSKGKISNRDDEMGNESCLL